MFDFLIFLVIFKANATWLVQLPQECGIFGHIQSY